MRSLVDRRRALPCAALLLTASAVFADQELDAPPQQAVKVGYVTFFPPKSAETEKSVADLKRVLSVIQRPLAAAGIPTAFEIAQGNDYQVLTWLRTGELDAALVSPFTAYLLRRDGDAQPILEVCEAARCEDPAGGGSAGYRGVPARVRPGARLAATVRAERDSITLADPLQEYDKCLAILWDESIRQSAESHAHGSAVRATPACEIWMVSHLSSSGFAAPVVYTQRWVVKKAWEAKAKDGQVGHFWHHFFSAIRFRMHQGYGESPTPAPGRVSIAFGDSRAPGWQAYRFAADGESSEIPNHVLVVRPTLLTRFTPSGTTLAPRRMGDWLLRAQRATAVTGPPPDRQLVLRPVDYGVHEAFARAIAPVFNRASTHNATLRQIVERWFVEGRFDFTVAELLDLLWLDQESSGSNRLSLVLPGGGVKSLYQAELLDRLYASGGLRNIGHGKTAEKNSAENVAEQVERPTNRPLVVQNVIGTSGGALVGLLAALRSTPKTNLTEVVGEAARKSVFPYVDVLRVLSVLVLLALFTIAIEAFSVYTKAGSRFPKTPHRMILPLLTALVAATLITATRADIGDASGVVAMVAAGTLLLIHFVFTCSVPARDRSGQTRSPEHRANILLLLTLAASCGGLAIWGERTEAAAAMEHGVGLPAMLAAGASVSTALAVAFVVAGGAFRLKLEGVREYWAAIGVLAAYVAAVYLVLTGLAYLEWSTLLEMTREFWIALLIVGSLFSVVFVAVGVLMVPLHAHACHRNSAADRLLRSYHNVVVFLAEHRKRSLLPSAVLSLLWFATMGVTWWLVMIAPALYGQRVAFTTFSSSVGQFVEAGHRQLTANLIVTGALVEDSTCAEERDRLKAGDMYFCFASRGENCGRSVGQRWIAIDAHAVQVKTLVDAAFASGSPFPIFPPKRVDVNNCAVDLIDGGYAHNVPLEAAFLGGTRQVLLINSAPDGAVLTGTERSFFTFGRLIRNAGHLLPFMFERAQQVDRDVQRHMLVASLTPSREHGEFPFLVDFRLHRQKGLLEAAACDWGQDRRIGRVERWGLPAVLARLPAAEPQRWGGGFGGLP
jgi:predicted acylesterase/phospholipase RssA